MIPARTHVTWVLIGLLMGGFTLGCSKSSEGTKPPATRVIATIETTAGPIEIELLPSAAPKTVENFRLLAQRDYFKNCLFFRVVKGFMIQTGDPHNDGKGGLSAWGGTFADEIDKASPLYRDGYKRGSVAMANYGPNTNTSQFFIVQKDYPLNPGYTIFGRVTKGIEVVDTIAEAPTSRGFDGDQSKPDNPVAIKQVTIRTESSPAP